MNLSLRRLCHCLLGFARPGRGARQLREGRTPRRPTLENLEDRVVPTGTWTGLNNLDPLGGSGTPILLSDGSVIVQGGGTTASWEKLTPDATGSYVNGTWSSIAPMGTPRLYFGSNVLNDAHGRVFVVGGEYTNAGQVWTNTGEIYDPVLNTWSPIAPFPNTQFGDDPTKILPNGNILAGYLSGPQTYFYNPSTNTWTAAGTKLSGDRSDEETWVKLPVSSTLPQGGILTYDVFSLGNAQVYNIATNTWTATGAAPNNLSSGAVGEELGPGMLLPDGRVFLIGATGQTAYYTPSTNSWVQGPVVPSGRGADDAPGAVLFNGKVLFAADTPLFNGPTHVYEFDPSTSTYTDVTPVVSGLSTSGASFTSRMLVLPTGQVLFTTGGNKLAVYNPDGSPVTGSVPFVTAVGSNGTGSTTFTLFGRGLNGINEGASYGDDAEMDSNYPIVQITDSSGHVFFARTHNWSNTGVAVLPPPVATTQFDLPAGVTVGNNYTLRVIANGVASNPYKFNLESALADPSFETPNVGTGSFGAFAYDPAASPWTFVGSSGVAGDGSGFTDGNPNAPDGTQVLFLQGGGHAGQSFNLAAGTYHITFFAAQRGNDGSNQTIKVYLDTNTTPILTLTPSSAIYQTVDITPITLASGGLHTLTLTGTNTVGDNTALVDDIQILSGPDASGGDGGDASRNTAGASSNPLAGSLTVVLASQATSDQLGAVANANSARDGTLSDRALPPLPFLANSGVVGGISVLPNVALVTGTAGAQTLDTQGLLADDGLASSSWNQLIAA